VCGAAISLSLENGQLSGQWTCDLWTISEPSCENVAVCGLPLPGQCGGHVAIDPGTFDAIAATATGGDQIHVPSPALCGYTISREPSGHPAVPHERMEPAAAHARPILELPVRRSGTTQPGFPLLRP